MSQLLNEPRLEAILIRERLDGLIATGLENVAYLAGYCCPVFWHVRETSLFAFGVGTGGTKRLGVVIPLA